MPEHDQVIEPPNHDDRQDLELIVDCARAAGRIALDYFGSDPKVWLKEGGSPVSEADHAVDRYLQETLLAARPDYGWLSEESTDNGGRLSRRRVFIVDPIDGTRGFIKGSWQWCVSIAIVEQGRPRCGVLDCPALEQVFTALIGGGARLGGKKLTPAKSNIPLSIAGPKPLINQYGRDSQTDVSLAPHIPSLALRLAMVASGKLDGAFARANSHDWDIAAADLILREAGARLTGLDNKNLLYNRQELVHGVLIAAGNDRHSAMLETARRSENSSTSAESKQTA